MINNEELPIGFTMELAQHSDVLNQFSKLTKEKQNELIEGAKCINSKDAMRDYVINIFK
ncbi:hypothetical protein C8E03_11640 [Lachnotalea glycerini]|jgi:hypothetical protein|uniref:Uncharacterized protein n=1 Tax=Lachnotalea glycerini TaxID=1763509 RepID=A0A318ERM0_9FIRM|nr:hypothetical protein [Lachnotalea glycerini]PXV85607.1 hypothetical protein C8E03_11640 [Lachnotalea glycerini]